jgi:hypothetical protein
MYCFVLQKNNSYGKNLIYYYLNLELEKHYNNNGKYSYGNYVIIKSFCSNFMAFLLIK